MHFIVVSVQEEKVGGSARRKSNMWDLLCSNSDKNYAGEDDEKDDMDDAVLTCDEQIVHF